MSGRRPDVVSRRPRGRGRLPRTVGHDEPGDDRRATRLQLVLHHWHLPLLDDADFVRYDPTNELVTITDEGVAIVDRIGDLPGSGEGVRVA